MLQPNKSLRQALLPAYAPCSLFGRCPQARWQPTIGHIPRGFLGATGGLEDVKVIMVFGEPGGVYPGDHYDANASPDDLLSAAIRETHRIMSSSRDLFHRNVRWFIDQIAPDMSFNEQLRHVWLTEGRLCSVSEEIGGFKDRSCADRYLSKQIEAMPHAAVVGFGGKAQAYLKALGVPHIPAYSLAPPGANHRPARPSWQAAIETIRSGQ